MTQLFVSNSDTGRSLCKLDGMPQRDRRRRLATRRDPCLCAYLCAFLSEAAMTMRSCRNGTVTGAPVAASQMRTELGVSGTHDFPQYTLNVAWRW